MWIFQTTNIKYILYGKLSDKKNDSYLESNISIILNNKNFKYKTKILKYQNFTTIFDDKIKKQILQNENTFNLIFFLKTILISLIFIIFCNFLQLYVYF